jgi:hypothetical protein
MTQDQRTMRIAVAIVVFVGFAATAWIWMFQGTVLDGDMRGGRAMVDVRNWDKAVMMFKEKH